MLTLEVEFLTGVCVRYRRLRHQEFLGFCS